MHGQRRSSPAAKSAKTFGLVVRRIAAGLSRLVTRQNGSTPQPAIHKTVLIVEDHELNMKLFHDLLQTRGYSILQARDGAEGLKLARQHRPDLIVMDVQLPEISGLEVMKWIKSDDELTEIPIVAVTAFAMKGDEENIRAGGCDAYIAKPISVRNFLETIERFIR
jgi:two-component system, cell cycle response regulator DivK